MTRLRPSHRIAPRALPALRPHRPHRPHRPFHHLSLAVSASLCGLAALATPQAARAQQAADPLPLHHAPTATHAAITPGDLETRLYLYADDSMAGRRAGTPSDLEATAYIAAEFKRVGLVPAGDSGTFFQNIPLVTYASDTTAALTVGGRALHFGTDYVPLGRRSPRSIDGVQVVYGGRLCDSAAARLSEGQAAGKMVLYTLGPGGAAEQMACMRAGDRGALPKSTGIIIPGLQLLPPPFLASVRRPQTVLERPGEETTPGPMVLLVSPEAVPALFPGSLDSAQVGAPGATIEQGPRFTRTPAPARNVIAILPGSDPRLKGEYVALGAHNDHIGVNPIAVDHDSIRAYNEALHALGAVDPFSEVDPARRAAIHINVDSLHHIRPARRDSINNGADDDGSGTVALLEIAENLAATKHHPRRSILFVSHTGEELGLFGSEYFTDHPTVPRDSIVAQLNMDMIGRGDSADIAGGGPAYLQLVGSRRLSTELGDIVEAVNKTEAQPFRFDYQYDANGHPENIYCRSDHYEYARFGIPIVFFTTGQHFDYHQVTDEPEYIDYQHLAHVTSFVRDVALRVANLDHRPLVDHPKPDPHGVCRQ